MSDKYRTIKDAPKMGKLSKKKVRAVVKKIVDNRKKQDDEREVRVNNPEHYTTSDAECGHCNTTLQQIWISRHMSFNLGNVIKYIWRCGKKSSKLENLEKAAWYLNNEINRMNNVNG